MAIKFSPKDHEIITNYLLPKIRGSSIVPNDAIVEEERIYSLEPWSLNWNHNPHLANDERYYFAKRVKASERNNKTGVKRYYSNNDDGFWKTAGEKFAIVDPCSKIHVLGYIQTLIFWQFKDNIKKDRRRVVRSQWLMHVYQLPGDDQFHQWVVCRVKDEARAAIRTGNNGVNSQQDHVVVSREVVSRIDYHHDLGVAPQEVIARNDHDHDLVVSQIDYLHDLVMAPQEVIPRKDHHLDIVVSRIDHQHDLVAPPQEVFILGNDHHDVPMPPQEVGPPLDDYQKVQLQRQVQFEVELAHKLTQSDCAMPGSFTALLDMPPLPQAHNHDRDPQAQEYDHCSFVASLTRVQSQSPLDVQLQEDVLLLPNYQITQGLIETPATIIARTNM